MRFGTRDFCPKRLGIAKERSDKRCCRCVVELNWLAALQDMAVIHHGNFVRHVQGFVRVMCHHDGDRTRLFEGKARMFAELPPSCHINAGKGFIQQDHRGGWRERTGKSDPLLLTA